MNGKLIKASLLLISASIMVAAGCGPMDINDAVNANEDMKDMADDSASDAQAQAPQAGAAKAPAQEGCPTGGCPTGGCPTGDCEIAPDPDTHNQVQLPDQVTSEPVQITPTSEDQLATHTIDYKTTKHVMRPHRREHTVNKHDNTIRRHFTKIVYHPSTSRVNRVVKTASVSDQVMPVEEVTEPTVDNGCVGEAPAPAPVVVRPVIVRPVPVVRPFYGYGWRGLY